jgi:hypothetical protein
MEAEVGEGTFEKPVILMAQWYEKLEGPEKEASFAEYL